MKLHSILMAFWLKFYTHTNEFLNLFLAIPAQIYINTVILLVEFVINDHFKIMTVTTIHFSLIIVYIINNASLLGLTLSTAKMSMASCIF